MLAPSNSTWLLSYATLPPNSLLMIITHMMSGEIEEWHKKWVIDSKKWHANYVLGAYSINKTDTSIFVLTPLTLHNLKDSLNVSSDILGVSCSEIYGRG